MFEFFVTYFLCAIWVEFITVFDRNKMNVYMRNSEPFDSDADSFCSGCIPKDDTELLCCSKECCIE